MPSSKFPPHVFELKGKLTFKRRFPKELIGHPALEGKTVLQRSLGTSDLRVALAKYSKVLAEYEGICSAAVSDRVNAVRHSNPIEPISIDDEELAFLALQHRQEIVQHDIELREQAADEDHDGPAKRFLEENWDYQFEDQLARYNALKTRDRKSVAGDVKHALKRLGVVNPKEHPRFEDLCRAFIDAELDAIHAIDDHREGRFGVPIGVDYLKTASTANPFEVPKFLGFAEQFICDTNPSSDWCGKIRYAAGALVECLGNKRIDRYSRTQIIEWVHWLGTVPKNASHRFKGLSIKEAIARNKMRDKPFDLLSPGSIQNSYKAAVGRVFRHAVDLELIQAAPTDGIKVPGYKKNNSKRPPFTSDELQRLFSLPIFTGCRSTRHPNTPGKVLLRNHYYWAPLLALYTGARAAELAQVLLAEIDIASAHPHILIQTDLSEDEEEEFGGSGRSLKNENAIREIPLHPELMRLGFFDYVRELRDKKAKRLFPEWKRGSKGFSGSSCQKNFNKIVRRDVSAKRPPPVFHSFRHKMRAEFVIKGVPSFHRNAILGHDQSAMDTAYVGPSIDIKYLYQEMLKVDHDGLQLTHLYPKERMQRVRKS